MLYTGNPFKGTLASGGDPDEIPGSAQFAKMNYNEPFNPLYSDGFSHTH